MTRKHEHDPARLSPDGAPDGSIAVIGLGAVLPGARSVDQYFRNLLHQRCFVRDIPPWLWEQEVFLSLDEEARNATYSAIAALVEDPDFDCAAFRIPPAVARMMSRAQKFALICAKTALEDAGLLDGKGFRRDRAAVIMGAIGGGEISESMGASLSEDVIFARLRKLAEKAGTSSTVRDLLDAYARTHPRFSVNEDTMLGASPNIVAGRIASVFDLHGPNLTLDAACASSLAALGAGVASLQSGESDLVIAGGVDTWIDIGAFVGFSKITALSRTGSYPFDRRAGGLVIGEGCGVAVLKRTEDALCDGDRIYAVIRGVGNSSDGRGKGITAPSSDGQVLAMQRAYERAGIDPATIDYMECHGTGTQVGDPVELESIRRLLEWAPRRRQASLPIGTVKSSIGHLRTAAGMAGLINSINVIQHRTIPPQTNFEHAIESFDWETAGLHVPRAAESLHDGEIRVGVSAYGFGGTNYHVVVSSPPARARRPRFEARDHLLPAVPEIDGDVAFLFPGQGSQYLGMLAGMQDTPIGRDYLARADAIVRELTGHDLSPAIYPAGRSRRDEERLQSTATAQPAILTVSAILLEMVRRQGVTCAMAIGHSLGEYTALHASGVLSFEAAIRAVTLRGLLMSRTAPGDEPDGPDGMVSLLGPPEDVDALLSKFEGRATRANLNSYEQIVVAGSVRVLRELVDAARGGGIHADWLNVDRAFHSPSVSHAVAPIRRFLDALDLRQTTTPIPANVSRQMYPRAPDTGQAGRPMSAADHRRTVGLLAGQIDQPVDFVSQVELAYRAGVRRFVEVGPRRILTGLVQGILQGKSFQCIALDDSSKDARSIIEALPGMLAEPLVVQRRPLANLREPQLAAVTRPGRDVDALPLEDHVRAVVADVSGYREDQIGVDLHFERDLGIDSLKLVEIVSRLRGRVLPGDYRGFRRLTSIAATIAEAREAAARPVERESSPRPAGIRCYLNRERAVAGGHDGVGGLSSAWRIDAPDVDRDELARVLGIDERSAQWLYVRPVGDSDTLCNELLPGLLDAVVGRARAGQREAVASRFALVTFGAPCPETTRWFRALSGFMRSVAKELPGVKFSYHHVDGLSVASAALRRCIVDGAIGRRLAADGAWVEATLEPLEALPGESLERFLGPDDVVLVSGGARGISACVVRSLLERVSSRFLVIGRQARVEPWILEAGAQRVEYLCADITDIDAVRGLDLAARGVTLLVHAAGLSALTPIHEKSHAELGRVLGVKVTGLENLVGCLDLERLRGIVNFSSIAAHFGNLGQADYAAANGFLDGYSVPSVPVLSIAWTAWEGVGMASRGFFRSVMETSGIELLPERDGVRIFEELLSWWLGGQREASLTVEVFGDLGVSMARQPEAPPARPPAGAVQMEQSLENVVTINPDGGATPVFMVCGLYGHAYRLLLLGEDAPPTIPFHALQPPGMDWSGVSCRSLQEMAAWYADTIEGIHPDGALALLGTSFGGSMVFEIALELQARGRTVEMLAMVDSMPPEEDPLEHESLAVTLRTERTAATDPIVLDGIGVAETHLQAVRAHEPGGVFRGRIQYYLHVGWGWPGRHDRRFLWSAYATGGMAIVPTSNRHGQFALSPARGEIADHVGRTLLTRDATTLSLDEYESRFASHALSRRDDGEWIRLPGGAELRVETGHGRGRLENTKMFNSRVWLTGWALDPASARPAHSVAVFCRGQLVRVVKPEHARPDVAKAKGLERETCGFTALIDVYTFARRPDDVYRLIAIGDGRAAQIAAFTLPDGAATEPVTHREPARPSSVVDA